ncbi:MAG: cytochrome c maturation protein CcmE [Anaerolineae bacterium]|nr:cytochrome c maturation protein CcmE [Thermoflexales bacterium]MDW8406771.1 cytochrome c maturation protein CcmE [Anaerolineae bacterium]
MKPRFVIGFGIILIAIIAMMAFTIAANSNLEVRVNDLLAEQSKGADLSERVFKLTGMVVGDSIVYDPASFHLQFDLVNSRDELVNNLATAPRITVVYKGVKPDTLMHEAQAIVTGKLGSDGRFYAGNSPDALLLQCPTKYENAEAAAGQ